MKDNSGLFVILFAGVIVVVGLMAIWSTLGPVVERALTVIP